MPLLDWGSLLLDVSEATFLCLRLHSSQGKKSSLTVNTDSAAMDLVLTAFPTLVIWKVQMVNREKVGVIASMSLGVM